MSAVRTHCRKGHDLSIRGTYGSKCRQCQADYNRDFYRRTRGAGAPAFRTLGVDRIRPLMWIATEEAGGQRVLARRFANRYGKDWEGAKKSLERILYSGPLGRMREDRVDEWLLLIGHDLNSWYPEELDREGGAA